MLTVLVVTRLLSYGRIELGSCALCLFSACSQRAVRRHLLPTRQYKATGEGHAHPGLPPAYRGWGREWRWWYLETHQSPSTASCQHGQQGTVVATPRICDSGDDKHIQTHVTVQRVPMQLLSHFSLLLEQIWVENSDGSGAVNFLTGMGGFLQAVLFGYTGFR